MPYSAKQYGSRAKYSKFRRCVSKVNAKATAVNPYAVCRKSIYRRGRK